MIDTELGYAHLTGAEGRKAGCRRTREIVTGDAAKCSASHICAAAAEDGRAEVPKQDSGELLLTGRQWM